MLSVHSEQPNKTGFPTVHALVLLEGTMNLTGETQPLVEQLMMVKRMQVGGPELPLYPQGGDRLCARGRILWSFWETWGFSCSWESESQSCTVLPTYLTALALVFLCFSVVTQPDARGPAEVKGGPL